MDFTENILHESGTPNTISLLLPSLTYNCTDQKNYLLHQPYLMRVRIIYGPKRNFLIDSRFLPSRFPSLIVSADEAIPYHTA